MANLQQLHTDNDSGQRQSTGSDGRKLVPHNNNHSNSDNNNKNDDNMANDHAVAPTSQKKTLRFWAIILALAVTGLLTALEATITSTALPTIIDALGGASLYVWVINIYFLTMYGLLSSHLQERV